MSLFGTLKKLAVNGGKGGEIDDLKAIIGKRAGLARQNRFVVIMNSPASSLINTDFQGLIGQALSGNIGLNDFIICCGYKGYLIKEYFTNYLCKFDY